MKAKNFQKTQNNVNFKILKQTELKAIKGGTGKGDGGEGGIGEIKV